MSRTAAIFFDVDFTLIHPGPRFQAEGYVATCAKHGVSVDPSKFDAAVAAAVPLLDSADQLYDPQVFVDFTSRIIELMDGDLACAAAPAREIYDDWAGHHHFTLYDDVDQTLRDLKARGVKLGLISNGHRSLTSFQSHFDLDGLISVAVSSLDHGYMKPHASIFQAALQLMNVPAAEAMMVGDSYPHDVVGAEQVGMRGVLLNRGGRAVPAHVTSPVIRSLSELSGLLGNPNAARP